MQIEEREVSGRRRSDTGRRIESSSFCLAFAGQGLLAVRRSQRLQQKISGSPTRDISSLTERPGDPVGYSHRDRQVDNSSARFRSACNGIDLVPPAGGEVVAGGGSGLQQIDAIMLVRTQGTFPSAIELLDPFAIGLTARRRPARRDAPTLDAGTVDFGGANTVRDQLARNAIGELRSLGFSL